MHFDEKNMKGYIHMSGVQFEQRTHWEAQQAEGESNHYVCFQNYHDSNF